MNKQLKPAIFDLIEKGHDNQTIVDTIGAAIQYVVKIRVEYNKLVGADYKKSRIKKPKKGSQCREVYDHLVSNPGCSFGELVKATGIDSSLCGYVRRRFFGLHGKRHLGIQPQPKAMHDVSLDELTL